MVVVVTKCDRAYTGANSFLKTVSLSKWISEISMEFSKVAKQYQKHGERLLKLFGLIENASALVPLFYDEDNLRNKIVTAITKIQKSNPINWMKRYEINENQAAALCTYKPIRTFAFFHKQLTRKSLRNKTLWSCIFHTIKPDKLSMQDAAEIAIKTYERKKS
jgi:hypothetical protein